jgi:serine/threonine protein kinase
MSMEPQNLGKYELRERLARNGQGEVWKAFDPQLRRYVAIKQLHANVQSDLEFISRFEREGQFIASLHHPNIVQIHDFQLIRTLDSVTTSAYIVMDYIDGPTLAEYIRNTSRKGQFPAAADIVYIFTAISLAIDYAHEKGMVHGDVKPANILLDKRVSNSRPLGDPTLTDFGIAKLQGRNSSTVPHTGIVYISPEQAQGQVANERSDLYSLGIILYEVMTGITPFRGENPFAIMMQHVHEMPTPPTLINPNISSELSVVILRSIAKDPNMRFPTASAMTIALAQSLNIPVPAELRNLTTTPYSSGANPYNPLQPPHLQEMTRTLLPPSSLNPDVSSPSAITVPPNDRQTPSTILAGSRPESDAFPSPGAITPASTLRESLPSDQVQFTAFYPAMTAVEKWTTLLVYVSLVSAISDIQADASRFGDELGALPRASHALSPFLLVRGTVLTIVPECQGITFNPPSVSFQWFEEWHRTTFRFQANKSLAGLACNGEIYIYAGPLLIGTLKMSLLFNDKYLLSTGIAPEKPTEVTGGIYQQMFVSYSHEDTALVEICRNIYRALGLTVLIDIDNLRSGQNWSSALEKMINTADVFQLFWSQHAAASHYVRQEWEYALGCSKGEGFIRPVYWEKPLVPPPHELAMLHFAYLPSDTFHSLPELLPKESSSRYPARRLISIGLLLFIAVLTGLLGVLIKGPGGVIIGLLIGIAIVAMIVAWRMYHHDGSRQSARRPG